MALKKMMISFLVLLSCHAFSSSGTGRSLPFDVEGLYRIVPDDHEEVISKLKNGRERLKAEIERLNAAAEVSKTEEERLKIEDKKSIVKKKILELVERVRRNLESQILFLDFLSVKQRGRKVKTLYSLYSGLDLEISFYKELGLPSPYGYITGKYKLDIGSYEEDGSTFSLRSDNKDHKHPCKIKSVTVTGATLESLSVDVETQEGVSYKAKLLRCKENSLLHYSASRLLLQSAENISLAAAKKAVEMGANLNAKSPYVDRYTPLHIVVQESAKAESEVLRMKDYAAKIEAEGGEVDISETLTRFDKALAFLNFLVSRPGIDVTKEDGDARKPLSYAKKGTETYKALDAACKKNSNE